MLPWMSCGSGSAAPGAGGGVTAIGGLLLELWSPVARTAVGDEPTAPRCSLIPPPDGTRRRDQDSGTSDNADITPHGPGAVALVTSTGIVCTLAAGRRPDTPSLPNAG